MEEVILASLLLRATRVVVAGVVLVEMGVLLQSMEALEAEVGVVLVEMVEISLFRISIQTEAEAGAGVA
jgi:hypothetical protein